eukprot:1447054-Rhodomonas_salina.2
MTGVLRNTYTPCQRLRGLCFKIEFETKAPPHFDPIFQARGTTSRIRVGIPSANGWLLKCPSPHSQRTSDDVSLSTHKRPIVTCGTELLQKAGADVPREAGEENSLLFGVQE